MNLIIPVSLSRSRKRERYDSATESEDKIYRTLVGTVIFLINGVMPQASLLTSKIPQPLGLLKVTHSVGAIMMTTDFIKLQSSIEFIKPPEIPNVRLVSLSDSSVGGGE